LNVVKRLDACVPNKLKNNSALLGVWYDARRIEYPARRRRATAHPEVQPPASASPDTAAAN
jgi:hypothetical protein